MRYLLVLGMILWASVASALELGVGLSYFSDSQETAPYFGVVSEQCGKELYGTFVREGEISHASAALGLGVYKVEEVAELYVLAGAGMAWYEWDGWYPELHYGLALAGEVARFTGRAGWTRTESGGWAEGTSSYYAGLYLRR